MRAELRLVISIGVLAVAGVALAGADSGLRILTYPVGVVSGNVPVTVDLGPSGAPADLFLDGAKVCSPTAEKPKCTVDLGADPHVHLLELIRRDAHGKVTARASRWVNRPGEEAELFLRLDPRTKQGICYGHTLWFHPLKEKPAALQVLEDGRSLRLLDAHGSFGFPCPDPAVPHVVAASAVFPDGRRAEAVVLSGGFGGEEASELTSVALAADDAGPDPCAGIAADLAGKEVRTDKSGFEAVFVLDPNASYLNLLRSGWTSGKMPPLSGTNKVSETIFGGAMATPSASWTKAVATFSGAEKLWFVNPDQDLHRINGLSAGRAEWLQLLFDVVPIKLEGEPRLADAVAASGLIAAAGPRRRAVVLILGNRAERDSSGYSPQQARSYLAEVGVPLIVFRNGKRRDDGWPEGVPVHNMSAMERALRGARRQLDQQCVAWFPGQLSPTQVAARLPRGLRVAGQGAATAGEAASVWHRAELEPQGAEAEEPASGAGQVWHGRVEVTAATVLVTARDADGNPVTDLEADQLQVSEDGRPQQVLGLERIPVLAQPPTQTEAAAAPSPAPSSAPPPGAADDVPVAIYVDRRLAGSADLAMPLKALAERADWLTSLGPVDVVVADRSVDAVLTNARRPDAVRETLAALAARPGGQHSVELIRSRFLREIRKIPQRLTRDQLEQPGLADRLESKQPVPQFDRSGALVKARSALEEEEGLLSQQARRLSAWALASPSTDPRLLLVLGAQFDEDPIDFYLPFVEKLEPQNATAARTEFERYRQSLRVARIARELAAAGWLVMPVAGRTSGSQAASASEGRGDRFQSFLSASPDVVRTQSPDWLLLDPIGTQEHLAAPSGGKVLVGAKGLDALERQASGWYRLSYQVDRAPDGAEHALAVTTSRPGTKVTATKVIASETTEGRAAARLDRLARGSDEKGDLAVEVEVSAPQPVAEKRLSASLTVRVDASALAPLFADGRERPFRVSLEVRTQDAQPFFLHRLVSAASPRLSYDAPIRWPAGPATLAVLVEDLGTGAWGATVQALAGADSSP